MLFWFASANRDQRAFDDPFRVNLARVQNKHLAAVLQHVHSNYEIDLFTALIAAVARQLGASDIEDKSLRVIADHLRSTAFLVADGVLPGNEGRGYVLRRIIRRAIRHGNKLGASGVFFAELLPVLVAEMGEAKTTAAATEP